MGLQGLWQPIAPDAAAPEEEAGLTSVLTAEIVGNELPSEVAGETARCFELQSAVSHQGELRCIHRTAGAALVTNTFALIWYAIAIHMCGRIKALCDR